MQDGLWQEGVKLKFIYDGKAYYINHSLATQLNSLVYNIEKDWDFVIIITGDRTVRSGKSVLAMTVCAYLAYVMQKLKYKTTFTLEQIYFDSKKMIDEAFDMPKNSIILYDEGREGLASSKYLSPLQQDLLDYFAECGQLNHIFVIVLADFFNLAEEIAVPRSECLINVYREDAKIETDLFHDGIKVPIVSFRRGNFEFFNRYRKQELYDKAKAIRRKNYGLVKADFVGSFTNQYVVDEAAYRAKKRDWLKRFKERKGMLKVTKTDIFRNKIMLELHNEGKNSKEIQKYLMDEYEYDIGDSWIRKILGMLLKNPPKNPDSMGVSS